MVFFIILKFQSKFFVYFVRENFTVTGSKNQIPILNYRQNAGNGNTVTAGYFSWSRINIFLMEILYLIEVEN